MKKKYFETKPGSLEAAVLEASSLTPKQKKLDLNKNGKIDGSDLAKLRAKKEDMTGDSVLPKSQQMTKDPIDIKTKSIANILSVNNYTTGYIGKWHLGSIPRNRFIGRHERLGFQEWKVCNCSHNYNESYYVITISEFRS